MDVLPLRLPPNGDLKQSLRDIASDRQIQAGLILTAVGSFKQVAIRFADRNEATLLQGRFELISLAGTVATTGMHLHLAVADAEGRVIGGHLMDGCIIYTTVELAIGVLAEVTFVRTLDPATGFHELEIKNFH